jgi:hypothetical protein
MKSRWVAVMLGLSLIAATVAAPAASERRAAAGSTDFQVELGVTSTSVPCPADVPPTATECRTLTPTGWVPGLGIFSETTYTLPFGMGPPTCPADLGKPLATTGRLIVVEDGGGYLARKGEIAFTLAEGARCVGVESAWNEPQEFTITGGTGAFAGASGSGQVERWLTDVMGIDDWRETWTGTLSVPGLHFALPKLTGAVAKTVRAAKGAKSARVTFEVTATDDGGGDVPVSCQPSSGSRFPLGETLVLCAATDSTGNTATAGFTVTVKRGH